jgi:putative lipoprotein
MRLALILMLSALCGCASVEEMSAPQPQPSPTVQLPITRRFQCEKTSLVATFHGDRVDLEFPGRSITLPQAISASGARYTDGVSTFWDKGGQATLELDGASDTCRVVKDPWQDAEARGVVFRAIGQEPGWSLEIDKATMLLRYDYGERELQMPTPRAESKGPLTTYEGAAESRRLRVVIEDRACVDTMSGEKFPQTVTVEVDGRTLKGCGRRLGSPG